MEMEDDKMKVQLHEEIIITMRILEARNLIVLLESAKGGSNYVSRDMIDEWINLIEKKLPPVD